MKREKFKKRESLLSQRITTTLLQQACFELWWAPIFFFDWLILQLVIKYCDNNERKIEHNLKYDCCPSHT